MRINDISLILITIISLSACSSTMNSDFSCNATAGDSCLTIEQVDAMTHFADDSSLYNLDNFNTLNNSKDIMKAQNKPTFNKGAISTAKNAKSIWLSSKIKEHQWT